MTDTSKMTIRQYWAQLAHGLVVRDATELRKMQGAFTAGVTALRDLLFQATRESGEATANVLRETDQYIGESLEEMERWTVEMIALQRERENAPPPDLTSDRTEFFEREVAPLLKEMIHKAQEQGIGVLASFELQRNAVKHTVKLGTVLVPSADGNVCDSMSKALDVLADRKEPTDTIPLNPTYLH